MIMRKGQWEKIIFKNLGSCFSQDQLRIIMDELAALEAAILSGETSWEAEGLTVEELECKLLSFKENLAQKIFEELKVHSRQGARLVHSSYSIARIDEIVGMVVEMVDTGQSSWEKLGFTKNQLDSAVNVAKVRWGIHFFARIDQQWQFDTLDFWENFITELVTSRKAKWRELYFSRDNLMGNLKKRRIHIAEDYFMRLKKRYNSLFFVEKFKAGILGQITRKNFSWEDLSFSSQDLKKVCDDHLLGAGKSSLKDISANAFCLLTVESSARFFLELLQNRHLTWDDLGIKEEEFLGRLKVARVNAANSFVKAIDSFSGQLHNKYADLIRTLVSSGVLSWEELEFTDDDLKNILDQTQTAGGKAGEDEALMV